ncbi:MAG TPA: TIM barrel protein [Bryobacteraceae bacterium]|nr:TIM barrel protein [Bryobacteraceae bacterium]
MKLAASNIAWSADTEQEVFRMLRRFGVSAIEVAPTRIWPEWLGATVTAAREYRGQVESEGLSISSLQAILFQKPELRLFGSDQDRDALMSHLRYCADLAAELGAASVVFGAPKNRDRGKLDESEAFVKATEFFSQLAPYYAARSTQLVLEANPSDYGCNFVTESGTAARLVRAVGADGFALHLDSACMHLAHENPAASILAAADILRHFHASEPNLAGFANPSSDHAGAATALAQAGYQGYVALEMRAGDPAIPALEQALAFVGPVYAGFKE